MKTDDQIAVSGVLRGGARPVGRLRCFGDGCRFAWGPPGTRTPGARGRTTVSRWLLIAVCVVGVLCLAGPSSALAGTASSDGTTIAYAAGPGEQNNVTVTPSDPAFGCTALPGQWCVEDSGAPVTPAGSCVVGASANEAHCPGSRFLTDLGDMNDSASLADSIPSEMSGGAGDDSLTGGGGADILRGGDGEDDALGGAGNDQIFGDSGDDLLFVGLNGGAGEDVVRGGDGRDSVGGGIGNDQLFGDAGDDLFFGDSGDDQIDGGADDDEAGPEAGNDTYAGGPGFDLFRTCSAPASPPMAAIPSNVSLDDQPNDSDCEGGATNNVRSDVEDIGGDFGPDTLTGSASSNVLRGWLDNDVLTGGPNSDLLVGEGGDDTINAQDATPDAIRCGSGNDTANVDNVDLVATDCETVNRPALLVGACANLQNGTDADEVLTGTNQGDRINGFGGTDIIKGLLADDCLSGGNDLDKLTADAGNDQLAGGAGDDIMSGGDDNDASTGGTGNDTVNGEAGNDRVAGDRGNDSLPGGVGIDLVAGGAGNDTVEGNAAADRLNGNAGRDRMSGGSGNDRMSGGAGNDKINGNGGRNRLSGGGGNDRIAAVNGRRDTINCGRGRRDRVRVDRRDLTRGCERVTRAR
jgi:Ca2+-binding RTX toxin-like protein